MVDSHSFLEAPEDTREAIMKATYQALCEHGYAGLTIARIAEDFEKSKSLLYHHYDSKDELLLDFLSFMLKEFERSVPASKAEGADERLEAVFERVLGDAHPDEFLDFTRAMVELRAQAAHDDRFQEHFADSDQLFHDQLATIIEDGIEAGVFNDVDPDQVAAFLLAALSGGMNHRVTADADHETQVQAELERYVSTVLLRE